MSWFFGPSKANTTSYQSTTLPNPLPPSPAESSSNATTTSPADVADDGASKCPVDHSTRAKWLQQNGGDAGSHPFAGTSPNTSTAASLRTAAAAAPTAPSSGTSPGKKVTLSNERETSSIPRYREVSSNGSDGGAADTDSSSPSSPASSSTTATGSGEKWVYPSPSQFYTALQRKNRSPREEDMDIVVPIHNAVNEQTWREVMKWENEAISGSTDPRAANTNPNNVQLVSFKGRPQDRTPRAWWKVLLGYQPPFDRHDWIIDRNGKRIRYVIDFYTGRGGASKGNPNGLPPQLAFYLDVRPALDDFEGVRMRVRRSLNELFGLNPSLGKKTTGTATAALATGQQQQTSPARD